MKISLDWLSDFVNLIEHDPQAIAERVTTAVAEVDAVEVQGALLRDCVVGKVLSIQKHPNADRLSLCEVQTDKGVKKVVCGGTNVRVGMRVAFAHSGATVRWHGSEMVTLQKTKIRGEESDGMICAAEELDLQSIFPQSTERNIIDLGDGDKDIGKPLKEYLGLMDVILHIDNHAITHRADLFSHLGFAREFVALGLATWKQKTKKSFDSAQDGRTNEQTFPRTPLPFRIINDAKGLVPTYNAALLEIESIGETPEWMKRRLEATGWRSVMLPVDITNYVLMEQGTPLHSFDVDDFSGDIHIRTSRKGETVTTLDEQQRALPEGALVISDDEGIFDLLGIMGGLRTSTKPATRRIFLQAAILNPGVIRKAIIATGHRTDGGTVYEKGVPQVASYRGLMRALELFTELVPGARIASRLENWGDEGKTTSIALPLERVAHVLGIDIPEKKIVKILEDLDFTVKTTSRQLSAISKKKMMPMSEVGLPAEARAEVGSLKSVSVTPPLFRQDIRTPTDLIEEIGRVEGYNSIEPVLPEASIAPPKRDARLHWLRDSLKAEGYVEVLPVSLVGADLLKAANMDPDEAVEIANPIGEEMRLLHTSTLPSLLAHAQRNILHAREWLQTFHWGHVFHKGQPETLQLSILLAQIKPTSQRANEPTIVEEPFYLLKSHLDSVFSTLGLQIDASRGDKPESFAHPGRFADLFICEQGRDGGEQRPSRELGHICELHPTILRRFDLPHRAAVAVIDLNQLLALKTGATVASPLPQFPAISYDVTVTRSHKDEVAPLLRELQGSDPLLAEVSIADLYSGKPLKNDDYNLTLRFTYRAPDRTLTEEEAQRVHEKILKKVEE